MLPSKLYSLIVPPSNVTHRYLKAEQKMCVEFANDMRVLTLQGKLPYVWFHVPNEFLPSERGNYSFERKQKHMGKTAGAPDYCFVGNKDSFFIEFKSDDGEQTDKQVRFESWCAMAKVDYFLCRSATEGTELVRERLKAIG
jgi:hypothetical protein